MNILSSNDINILDLPDEMLRAIFNKLNMVDMLYSLVDVNQRFDRLAFDSLHIYHLNFASKRDNTHNSSVDIHILDRICSKILPRINEKIIGSSSDQRYPTLLIDLDKEYQRVSKGASKSVDAAVSLVERGTVIS